MEEKKTELKMIKMSEVQSQEIEWLWYPFIPYGKLTIVQGDPGDGKTTLILNIAAKLSKGEGMDNDMKLMLLCLECHLHLVRWTPKDASKTWQRGRNLLSGLP